MAPSTILPDAFVRAVEGLRTASPRPEILLEEMPAPTRLAPYAHAVSGTVLREDEQVATGRLVLLHDPAGNDGWDGEFRLVTYVTADLEPELAADPMLPGVGWSWLVDALEEQDLAYTAIAGTITQTLSTRFGELGGPPSAADLEIRASWTPLAGASGTPDLARHLAAWCSLLASAAGLPPPGITALPDRPGPAAG
jgi:hypothetical protein